MRLVLIIIISALSCKRSSSESSLLGSWCYSDKKTDFTAQFFERNDTVFIEYSYVLDSGTRINETIDNHSGYITKDNLNLHKLVFPVTDEYGKSIGLDNAVAYVYDIKLSFEKSDSILVWEDISISKSKYLPHKIELKKCN